MRLYMNGLDKFKYANSRLYVKMNQDIGGIILDKKNKKCRLFNANIYTSYSKYNCKYMYAI